MVDAGFLARMKDGALLVNAARGTVVVTAALVAELRRAGCAAALDVTDPEPLPPGHPLWDAPGLFITPARGRLHAGVGGAFGRVCAGPGRRFIGRQPLENVIAGKY